MPVRVPREYVPGESRYAVEFIQTFYPGWRFSVPFRMGIHPLVKDEDIERYPELKEWKGVWADADGACWKDGSIKIVECKLRTGTYREGVSALEDYQLLADLTPLIRVENLTDREYILVTPIESPLIALKCFKRGFRNVIWTPNWYDEFISRYPGRYKEIPEYEKRLAQLLKGELTYPRIVR